MVEPSSWTLQVASQAGSHLPTRRHKPEVRSFSIYCREHINQPWSCEYQISDIRPQHDLNTRSTPWRYKYQISDIRAQHDLNTRSKPWRYKYQTSDIRPQHDLNSRSTPWHYKYQISDIRAQHDLNVSSTKLGRVMVPAVADSNVQTLTNADTYNP
jgi:hypothetical protein